MTHSIDLHASRTATDKSMHELAPGQSLVYQFQAQYLGIFMYHCGAAPALEHIANGMFGAVVIDSWRGVGTGIYVLGSLTEFLIEGGVRGSWQQRRRRKRMDSLPDHYITSGFGRVGRRIAEQLQRKSDTPFVIVETTPSAIAFAREAGYLYYEATQRVP